MKKYLIAIYGGSQGINDKTICKTFYNDENAAYDSFIEQFVFAKETLDHSTCRYVAVALESVELDEDQEELIDTFTTIKYVLVF